MRLRIRPAGAIVLAASVAVVLGSLLTPAPSREVQARHEQVRLSLREQGY